MSVKKLTKNCLADLIDNIIAEKKVFGVQSRNDKFEFAPLSSAKDLRLDYDVTLQAPKKFFQPPCETLMTYKITGNYESQLDDEEFVLLGVHPYDMVAINQMDELFSQDNYDVHYMTRRDNVTIIACDVETPSENVFASSMGTAVVEGGFDVLLTNIGDGHIAEAATNKGERILAMADGAEDATKRCLQARQRVWDRNRKSLNKHQLNCSPSDLPGLLEDAYKNPVWEEKAKTCFACGSCNLVCPTCYCFDVCDDVNWDLNTGQRDRTWDGCLLNGFTKVAGDHEFRSSKADRFRHRLYRKAKYVPAKIGGQIACVGCGRCISACLPDIANPVNIYNKLLEEVKV